MIYIYLIVTILTTVIAYYIYRNKLKGLNFIEVPDLFFKLDSTNRKLALNLVWNPTEILRETAPIKSNIFDIIRVISIIISLLTFFVILAFSDDLEKFDRLRDSEIFKYIFIMIVTQISVVMSVYTNYRQKMAAQEELINKRYLLDIQKLAISMIRDNFPKWYQSLIEKTKAISLEENNLKPMQLYMLLDESKIYIKNSIPSSVINIAYIFLNGYISVVDNIKFMIEETTYTLVDKDTPQLIHNSSNNWSTEEFHFKDIVEVNYNTKSISTTNLSSEYNTGEGFLTLTLSNGSIKQYPTSKTHINSFINIAREKVRNLKM